MNLEWAAAGALLGLPAGTSLRLHVSRLSARSGEPEHACCARCAAPLPGWPAFQCERCGSWLGAPLTNEVLTAAILGALFARFGGQAVAGALAYLGTVGVALSLIDLAVQRLPDRLTLPAYPALVALLALAAALDGDGGDFVRAVLGCLAIAASFLLLSLASGGRLGGGDIKLAGLLGLALGWLGWRTLVTGACLGFVLAAAGGLALLAGHRATRHSMISFGPYMLGGALVAVLASSS